MKLFFDTEFTGLHKNTTLISIGIVSEDNRAFYAEFTDYDLDQCDIWIIENVIHKLILDKNLDNLIRPFGIEKIKIVKGDTAEIEKELRKWLGQFQSVQFVSDVCHYDFTLLIDIFGEAFKLPSNVSPVCYDINQDIAKVFCVSDREAFDMNREEIVKRLNVNNEIVDGELKHNSLYDAVIIREIYNEIQKNLKDEAVL